MKISQMTTNQAAEVLVKITDPVAHILADKDAISMVEDLTNESGMEGVTAALMRLVPYCLDKHKLDTFTIVGALAMKSCEEVAEQNILVTIRDVLDSVDKDLISFFQSLKKPTAEHTES